MENIAIGQKYDSFGLIREVVGISPSKKVITVICNGHRMRFRYSKLTKTYNLEGMKFWKLGNLVVENKK